MPYKTPNIPIFPELLGAEKRVQNLQQRIGELDWLEYSFGLVKRVTIERGEEMEIDCTTIQAKNSIEKGFLKVC